MGSGKTFEEKSYRQHAEHFKEYIGDGEKGEHAKTWFDKDTVDAWRHQRMYEAIDAFIELEPDAAWVTLGDGRYGNDAKYIQEKGGSALATDISDYLLKEAKKTGYIADYRIENAEALSFQDSEFDYAYCKESYHHFPRPMIALYEMLRVVIKAVILTEPNDVYCNQKIREILFGKLVNLIKILLSRDVSKHAYEESGNFLYSLGRREAEKLALGLNYKMVAFKGVNDFYCPGVEYEHMADNGPLQKKTRRFIRIKNLLCKLGFLDYNLISVVIFKTEPGAELLQRLRDDEFEIVELPENPYITE
jgi:ubiquinone/menaquinone biosynthesis C-methylase UbiE